MNIFFLSITEYSIDYDRDYLEEMVKKSRDPQDKVYAEMLLQKKSIKEACQNPFSNGGWSRRNSVATRRISNVSEISLSFIYGKQLSITDIEECEPWNAVAIVYLYNIVHTLWKTFFYKNI